MRLGLDSDTSHQPPSKDVPWKPKSERQKSERSSGGQVGHKGRTLKFSEHVDERVVLPLAGRCACGQVWTQVEVSELVARQVHDVPELRLYVREYQAEVKVCPCCAARGQAPFPDDVRGQVQYGPGVHALSTLLNVGHFIPLQRTADIVNALFGTALSDGTVALNLQAASKRLEPFEQALKTALGNSAVIHADETGSKVNGERWWFHVACTANLTHYSHHATRGIDALKAADILPNVKGVVVHDAWNTYFQLPGGHALCHAHLLRELRGLHEYDSQEWAAQLRQTLQEIHHLRLVAPLTEAQKNACGTRFDELVLEGLQANPPNAPIPGQRGNPKQSRARNVALRCQKHRSAMLLFLERDDVPFDNNQAERDIRMLCVKRKVSGGFRSDVGGQAFCRVRSLFSTFHKQGRDVWGALLGLFRGQLPSLVPSC